MLRSQVLWDSQYYQHSLGDTLSWALPVLLRQGELAEARRGARQHALLLGYLVLLMAGMNFMVSARRPRCGARTR